MNKYVAEFIGTLFLVLTVGCTVITGATGVIPPLAIGSALMIMVYATGHLSGGYVNPAVTLGVWIRERCPTKDVIPYWVAQILAGFAAAAVVKYLRSGVPVTAMKIAMGPALVAEFLFTFALVFVVLNSATAKGTTGNSFYGLAIGFTVLTGAFAVGDISAGRSTRPWPWGSRPWVSRRGRTSGSTWSPIWSAARSPARCSRR